MVYMHDQYQNATTASPSACRQIVTAKGERKCARGAIGKDGWRLVVGPGKQNGWFGWFSPNITDPVSKKSPALSAVDCLPNSTLGGCLFDLNSSMTEHDDVAGSNPAVMAALLAEFDALADDYHPPQKNPPIDVDGYCAAVRGNRNFVGPWLETTIPCDTCG